MSTSEDLKLLILSKSKHVNKQSVKTTKSEKAIRNITQKTWYCGQTEIHTTRRDKNPRFDRRLEIYLDLKPNTVDIQKIASFLKLLDKLGSKIK